MDEKLAFFELSPEEFEGELTERATIEQELESLSNADISPMGACWIRQGNRFSCFSGVTEKACDDVADEREASQHVWFRGESCY